MAMVLMGSDYKTLKHGDPAPGFSLPGADGNHYALESFRGAKALLIVFMCNHCPYVKAKIEELNRIANDFRPKGLIVIGINPNEDQNHPEDSFYQMMALVKQDRIRFFYLRDDSQQIAKAYGAVCTPDPFLFDANQKLVFHGRIDDTHGDQPATVHELYAAIDEFLRTGAVTRKEQPSMGCSIKWK
jgi:peroxiredoxin